MSTIGESAAMGTAGVVIWERSETKTEVHNYMFALTAYAQEYVYTLIQLRIFIDVIVFYFRIVV